MLLDAAICSQARKTRDSRFDGRFFIGVLTTGIYCRPVCPARSPKEENIRYFPSAAAAAEAGLRPCLRCRPECSPGTPAWLGTSATISRALRLIGDSALDMDGIEGLAARLGVGSRHLRRLFLKHLGAGPIAVIQTRRLHFAKKLIDETQLSMRDIALASGFGSVRRFNACFQKTYQRTPTQLRRYSGHAPALPKQKHEYRFVLRYRAPFCWRALLNFLSPRAIPGVENVDANCYRRSFSLEGHVGWMEVSHDTAAEALCLRTCYSEPRWLFAIVERVRRMFDLAADTEGISTHLAKDPVVAARIAGMPGLRVPGCWDGFELAVRAILGQQVTVRGASTLAGRLVQELGAPFCASHGLTHLFPTPEKIAAADLRRIGLPQARANCIRTLAAAVRDGKVVFHGATAQTFLEEFRKLPGIGEWTAQYVAMRAFGEPDAFPTADLGLLRAVGTDRPRELEARAEAWRPWRAYAAIYLWQGAPENGHRLLHKHRYTNRPAPARRGQLRPATGPVFDREAPSTSRSGMEGRR